MTVSDRQNLINIFYTALEAVDPYVAVCGYVDEIARKYRDGKYQKLYVFAVGKGAAPMARAVIDSIGKLVTGGIVITKYGHAHDFSAKTVRMFEAGHPVPDAMGYLATKEALKILKHHDEHTFILCLISGGGSSLFLAPYEGISLAEKQEVTRILLRVGADIYETNAVRKHISLVKGGRLAALAYPARVESLVFSDVLGDRLDVIASGPTFPDKTTFGDAMDVIHKYRIEKEIPANVLQVLIDGVEGLVSETPKEGDPIFRNVNARVIGSNASAIEAAKKKAEQLGFEAKVVDTSISGEAKEVGRRLARKALAEKAEMNENLVSRPLCLICGGETTVTVRGLGIGGRNMELALAFALEIDGEKGITLLSAGTDGGDGPTDSAGAVVDGFTVSRGYTANIDPEKCLQNNDSYSYFKETKELLITGPTGTNVMDLQIALLRP